MRTERPLPPVRKLRPDQLDAREAHLLAEIHNRQRPERVRLLPRRTRSVLGAAVAVAALAATPALAFSSSVRQLVGIEAKRSPAPTLQATITSVTSKPRHVGEMMTLTFTVGEPGKAPGTGIPKGSVFQVLFVPKHGKAASFTTATGANGHYRVSHWVPRGGLKYVLIGGWLNRLPMPTAAGGFYIPITVVNHPY